MRSVTNRIASYTKMPEMDPNGCPFSRATANQAPATTAVERRSPKDACAALRVGKIRYATMPSSTNNRYTADADRSASRGDATPVNSLEVSSPSQKIERITCDVLRPRENGAATSAAAGPKVDRIAGRKLTLLSSSCA